MFLTQRNRGILITCLVCILFTSITYLAWSYAIHSYVTFTTKKVNCNLSADGTFTRELHQNGSTTWSPYKPNKATIHVGGTAYGAGEAAVEVASGTVHNTSLGGAKHGDTIGSLGWFLKIPVIPWIRDREKVFNTHENVTVPTADGTYNWNAVGKFYTRGSQWTGISWHAKPESYSSSRASGSWTVKTEKVCANCGKYVSDFTTHQVSCAGCRETYYTCSPSDVSKHNFQVCMDCVYNDRPNGVSFKCQGPHSCYPTDDSDSSTNSNTVSSSGGTVSSSGSGSTSGDSSSRVRCANMPAGVTRHTQRHCDKGGYASSAYAHRATCYAHSRPITYWTCEAAARRYHSRH